LLDEQGRVEAAVECLRTTLQVAPDYADAMFNLALLLQRINQYAEAGVGACGNSGLKMPHLLIPFRAGEW
jgi:hypothetical protein